MKAAVLEGVKKLIVKEIPTPVPDDDMALVRVKACGICMTDYKAYSGERKNVNFPAICGHEFSGVIEKAGEKVKFFKPGDEIIASYKRVASNGDLRANIHAGGKGKAFNLTPELEEVVFKSAEAVKAKICAVDIIESNGVPNVLEVNINPGLQGIENSTGINVAKRIIDFVNCEMKN